jgi:dienelactone hydrolase
MTEVCKGRCTQWQYSLVSSLLLMVAGPPCCGQNQTPSQQTKDADQAQKVQVYFGATLRNGESAEVTELAKGSPAEAAGIKAGDIILKIGAVDVKDTASAVKTIRSHKPGDKVTVKLRRNDQEMEVEATMGSRVVRPEPSFEPEVAVQTRDYALDRKDFRTKLVHEGPSPQKGPMPEAPAGVRVVDFPSGNLRLKAWINQPDAQEKGKRPAVVFLHGGFGFGPDDWKMAQPYRDAGYVVLAPLLRGENGQAGTYTLLYDEVDDALAAADYLARQPFVDSDRLFVAGHSVGGILAQLAAQTSKRFRAAASFSGSTDQVLYCRYGIDKNEIPFDLTNPRETQMRSPLAYAASFKCPVRLYYGSKEKHFAKMTARTAAIAKEKGLDVEAISVEGDHMSSVPEAMRQSIVFFEKR